MNATHTAVYAEYGEPLTLANAQLLANAAERHAERSGWRVAISILDSRGSTVLAFKMDQTQLAGLEVAEQKARTALSFRRATIQFERAVADGGSRLLTMKNLLALQGGFPITAGGKVVGAIGVSGATGAQDSEVAEAALAAMEHPLPDPG